MKILWNSKCWISLPPRHSTVKMLFWFEFICWKWLAVLEQMLLVLFKQEINFKIWRFLISSFSKVIAEKNWRYEYLDQVTKQISFSAIYKWEPWSWLWRFIDETNSDCTDNQALTFSLYLDKMFVKQGVKRMGWNFPLDCSTAFLFPYMTCLIQLEWLI